MRHILITGASSGIGAAAAVSLTRAGHRVLATGRSAAKLAAVGKRMAAAAPDGAEVPAPIAADLSSLTQITRLADRVRREFPWLDVLVNNAGIQPHRRVLSPDGYELALAVNHLAPFRLTELLAGLLAANGGRVVTTASSSHAKAALDLNDLELERRWSASLAYANSKLANILFTSELAGRTRLPATSFHPGSISTDLNRDSPVVRLVKPFERLVFGSPESGADTLAWLCTDQEGAAPASCYYVRRRPADMSAAAQDQQLAAGLWDATIRLLARGARPA